jgi:hypothetical protein
VNSNDRSEKRRCNAMFLFPHRHSLADEPGVLLLGEATAVRAQNDRVC